jgi:hypothetical protein
MHVFCKHMKVVLDDDKNRVQGSVGLSRQWSLPVNRTGVQAAMLQTELVRLEARLHACIRQVLCSNQDWDTFLNPSGHMPTYYLD